MLDEPMDGFRSGWDYFHFALAAAGFFLAVGGAVLSSPCLGCCGLVVMAWGVAYFVVNNSDT
jgi:hypothetical protein